MILMKGKRWSFSIESISKWKETTSPPDPVPFYGMRNNESDDKKFDLIGIYAFPFALRIAKKI